MAAERRRRTRARTSPEAGIHPCNQGRNRDCDAGVRTAPTRGRPAIPKLHRVDLERRSVRGTSPRRGPSRPTARYLHALLVSPCASRRASVAVLLCSRVRDSAAAQSVTVPTFTVHAAGPNRTTLTVDLAEGADDTVLFFWDEHHFSVEKVGYVGGVSRFSPSGSALPAASRRRRNSSAVPTASTSPRIAAYASGNLQRASRCRVDNERRLLRRLGDGRARSADARRLAGRLHVERKRNHARRSRRRGGDARRPVDPSASRTIRRRPSSDAG